MSHIDESPSRTFSRASLGFAMMVVINHVGGSELGTSMICLQALLDYESRLGYSIKLLYNETSISKIYILILVSITVWLQDSLPPHKHLM